MAAPPSKTIGNLNGRWVMNKTLSDSTEPVLALQGVGWFIRKGVAMASVTLDIKQYEAPPSPPVPAGADATTPCVHIDIEQTATGGIKGTTENRCADWNYREHSDWMFGSVKGRSKFLGPDEIDEDEHLRKGWLEDESERTGPGATSHLLSVAESNTNGWVARQIWGFQMIDGERYYCRNILVTKGNERAEVRLVYDFVE